LDNCARDGEPALRAWATRITGELGEGTTAGHERLLKLAADPDASVRAAVATALRQFGSGSLTVDSRPTMKFVPPSLMPVFGELLARASVDGDFYYPHIVWMAMEPRV